MRTTGATVAATGAITTAAMLVTVVLLRLAVLASAIFTWQPVNPSGSPAAGPLSHVGWALNPGATSFTIFGGGLAAPRTWLSTFTFGLYERARDENAHTHTDARDMHSEHQLGVHCTEWVGCASIVRRTLGGVVLGKCARRWARDSVGCVCVRHDHRGI
jgi:hypothetical protein